MILMRGIFLSNVAKLSNGDRAVYVKNGERALLTEDTFKWVERRLRYVD